MIEFRTGQRIGLAFALILAGNLAHAEDLDSEHLFGFTEGTDIGAKGERELELGAFGRLAGFNKNYVGLTYSAETKFTITDSLRIAPGILLGQHHISNIPGLAGQNRAGFQGFTFEIKYQLLSRAHNPFGLTVGLIPTWSRIDELTGTSNRAYGFGFLVSADKEIIHDTLFGAVNVTYAPEKNKAPLATAWQRSSELGVSAALAYRVSTTLFLGGEVRHVRAYDSLGLGRLAGHSLFVGPTFYARLSESSWIGGAWGYDVSAKNFSLPPPPVKTRHEARIRFGKAF